ncbi:DUF4160 domain-containing protein [Flavobacterium sp. RHBU_24]|uniref:DUF4160 domain-containing protein n=1 Tax=Flavobacterium sp. RHBU_24 TaxID=3391185 RepID=UPI0039851723
MSLRILIYDNDHPPPHCHLRRSDGSESRVAIPSLKVMTGPALSKKEKEAILDQLDELCDKFDQFNPPKHKDEENEK